MKSGKRTLSFVLALSASAATAAPHRSMAISNDTTPMQFVQSYVSELATFEDLRDGAAKELEADKAHPMMACIHSNTLYDLEAGAAVRGMRSTHLVGVIKQLQGVPQTMAAFYGQRQQTVADLTRVCLAFAQGPKEGVDYVGLSTLMPQFRATLEYIDKAIFEASPLVFATLISDVPDSKGHASHLVISCDERKHLVSHIDNSFGAKLAEKNANFGVSQAKLFRAKLLEYKCAEEPR